MLFEIHRLRPNHRSQNRSLYSFIWYNGVFEFPYILVLIYFRFLFYRISDVIKTSSNTICTENTEYKPYCRIVCHIWFQCILPKASFGLRVLSLPASVCVCVCMSVCQSRVCLRDNSSPVQARITKFRVQMQNTLVRVLIVLWGERLWPSRSNLTWKSNLTSVWACPDDNVSSVQARVTKLGPKMHLNKVKIPIDLKVDQPRSAGSILT